jgi:putative redox protein
MEESLINHLINSTKLNGRTVIAYSHLADSMLINITNGRHFWNTDEPPAYQGNDLAPNPVELLMASLASCTLVTVIKKCKENGIPIKTIAVTCGYVRLLDTKDVQPADVTTQQRVRITKSIFLPDITDADLLGKIKSFADNCPVESILTSELQINTEFKAIEGN